MQAEAVLVRAKLPVKMIPTPRDLSSDCGIALRFDWCQNEQVQTLLNKARVEIAGVHRMPA